MTNEIASLTPKEKSIYRAWLEEEDVEQDDYQIEEYDLTSAPNDFNITTIHNFIISGAVKIPSFQRNYVWDINRASKLIESIIIGLPVPQIFLYEEGRNRFLVIDGQQRLMSIYYFITQRFPRKDKRSALRRIFAQEGHIPDGVIHDDAYFTKFDLRLPVRPPNHPNKFSGLNYSTLGDYQTSFNLRTIRNVIVKQNQPKDDKSSIYEIFNRLNSGGTNLEPQEIRASLYDSDFYAMLHRINVSEGWRKILGEEEPDLHLKDLEILLRSFAMLLEGAEYKSSMSRFLDAFSKSAKKLPMDRISYLEELFLSFIRAANNLPANAFRSEVGKFNISVFESVFAAVCNQHLANGGLIDKEILESKIAELKNDQDFQLASQKQTTNKSNVEMRLARAKTIFSSNTAP
jgi:hypothetical protein